MQVRGQRTLGDRAGADRADHVAGVHAVADLDADILAEIRIQRALAVGMAYHDRVAQRVVLADAFDRAYKVSLKGEMIMSVWPVSDQSLPLIKEKTMRGY